MGGFVPFTPDHLAVLAGLAAGVAALLIVGKRLRGVEDRGVRWGVAVLLAANELIALIVAWRQGMVRVPFQLCELALYLTLWALVSLRPSVCRMAYCWGVCGSLQAVLTPDLAYGFPDYWWIKFFISHVAVMLSAVYLAVSGRVVLTLRSIWRVWVLTNGYAAAAGAVNWAFGTNYGYLAHKPARPSLLDYAGPWPFYLAAMDAIALVSFALSYLPFVFGRRLARRG